jgi:hypothetical protein
MAKKGTRKNLSGKSIDLSGSNSPESVSNGDPESARRSDGENDDVADRVFTQPDDIIESNTTAAQETEEVNGNRSSDAGVDKTATPVEAQEIQEQGIEIKPLDLSPTSPGGDSSLVYGAVLAPETARDSEPQQIDIPTGDKSSSWWSCCISRK